MDEPLDSRERAALRIRGDLDMGIPHVNARFAAVEVTHDAGAPAGYHLRIDGALGEIRKLRAVNHAFDKILSHLESGPDDAPGSITLRATPDLARELATAERSGLADLERVAFAIERYEPESVTRRTAEWSM